VTISLSGKILIHGIGYLFIVSLQYECKLEDLDICKCSSCTVPVTTCILV